MTKELKRCEWCGTKDTKPHYVKYHDEEWGVPTHDDRDLFEMLILEGAQAGLSWETILKKREGYRKLFYNFNVNKCTSMADPELEKILLNPAIVRNRLKVYSVRKNAAAFIDIQKEYGSFNKYIWQFTKGKIITSDIDSLKNAIASNALSDTISKDLKKRGMSFVGTTIIYAYLQSIGVVNDHFTYCFKHYKKQVNS